MSENAKYAKLIRDKIPEIIKARGDKAVTHVAGDQEYWQKLKEKLKEEVAEYIYSEEPEELADIMEVIQAICSAKDIDVRELESIRQQKLAERGGFEKRIILEQVTH